MSFYNCMLLCASAVGAVVPVSAYDSGAAATSANIASAIAPRNVAVYLLVLQVLIM